MDPSTQTTVWIVDDHPIVGAALGELAPKTIVVEKCLTTLDAAFDAAADANPDVLLVDFLLDGETCVSRLSELRSRFAESRIAVITGYPDPRLVQDVWSQDVHGFIDKGEDPEDIIYAIKRIAAGKRYVSSRVVERMITLAARSGRSDPPFAAYGDVGERLTDREREVLQLLAGRQTVSEIAGGLCITPATVKSHLRSIYSKLGVSNRRDAAVRALEILSRAEP